jgi:enoyl-CoA hydratase/carnithine racemase
MLMLGERHGAADLARLGLAYRVVPAPEVEGEAIALASRLASLPEAALGRMKRVLAETGATALEHALARETEATVAGFLDPESTRRIADF